MNRQPVRLLALGAILSLLALTVPALSTAAPADAAAAQTCTPTYPTPVLTGYGVMSETKCDGTPEFGIADTCNQILATWNGYTAWIINGGADTCNSNSPSLDFGPCAPGTWKYRTFVLLSGAYGLVGARLSDEVPIHC
jgi:hypothetical protein